MHPAISLTRIPHVIWVRVIVSNAVPSQAAFIHGQYLFTTGSTINPKCFTNNSGREIRKETHAVCWHTLKKVGNWYFAGSKLVLYRIVVLPAVVCIFRLFKFVMAEP